MIACGRPAVFCQRGCRETSVGSELRCLGYVQPMYLLGIFQDVTLHASLCGRRVELKMMEERNGSSAAIELELLA